MQGRIDDLFMALERLPAGDGSLRRFQHFDKLTASKGGFAASSRNAPSANHGPARGTGGLRRKQRA